MSGKMENSICRKRSLEIPRILKIMNDGEVLFTIEDFMTLIMWYKLAFRKQKPTNEDDNTLVKVRALLLSKIDREKMWNDRFDIR